MATPDTATRGRGGREGGGSTPAARTQTRRHRGGRAGRRRVREGGVAHWPTRRVPPPARPASVPAAVDAWAPRQTPRPPARDGHKGRQRTGYQVEGCRGARFGGARQSRGRSVGSVRDPPAFNRSWRGAGSLLASADEAHQVKRQRRGGPARARSAHQEVSLLFFFCTLQPSQGCSWSTGGPPTLPSSSRCRTVALRVGVGAYARAGATCKECHRTHGTIPSESAAALSQFTRNPTRSTGHSKSRM